MVYGGRNRHSPLCSSASSFPKLWFEASLYKLLSQVVAFHYYCFFMHQHHHWLICALLDLALYLLACFSIWVQIYALGLVTMYYQMMEDVMLMQILQKKKKRLQCQTTSSIAAIVYG
jgi:hypothetical protein